MCLRTRFFFFYISQSLLFLLSLPPLCLSTFHHLSLPLSTLILPFLHLPSSFISPPPPPHTYSNGYYISSSASVSVGSTSIGPARSASSSSGTVEEILILLTKQMEAYTLPVDIW